jgi:antitoxin component YwqK of YwqJK toxin-antitoxin module
MRRLILIWLLATNISGQPPYKCGDKEIKKRPYGTVEFHVDCEDYSDNILTIIEHRGKEQRGPRGYWAQIQHGIQMDFDTLWRKRDSVFFVKGKKNGTSLYWDTLGNVIGKRQHRNGIPIGKDENYWSPGHPSVIKNYNAKGQEHGLSEEWWKDGIKKGEWMSKNDQIISGLENYRNGKPRIKYLTKYNPKPENFLKAKYISAESWAPSGKPAGKIERGNGEWLLFSSGEDSTDQTVFREIYKDSLLIKVSKLDSAEISKWLKP